MLMGEMANARYRRIVERIDGLPSLPSIVTRLIKVVNSPDTAAEDAAVLIEKDPALTSKILRLANSAFYGRPRAISSVPGAVVVLGFNTIRSLALGATIMKILPAGNSRGFDQADFWRHSIVCAMTAKAIARRRLNQLWIDPESAFCAGILHDIGKLILSETIPNEYAEVCERARNDGQALIECERSVLGFTHAEVGSAIADKWALPADLEHCLVYHHTPGETTEFKELISAVHLSDIMTHTIGIDLWIGERKPAEWTEARAALGLTESDEEPILTGARDSLTQSEEFYRMLSG